MCKNLSEQTSSKWYDLVHAFMQLHPNSAYLTKWSQHNKMFHVHHKAAEMNGKFKKMNMLLETPPI